MRKCKNQRTGYENGFLAMNDIRTSVARALAGIFIRACNICKIAITVAPIILILYLVGYIFFKENIHGLLEMMKRAFMF